MVTALDAADVLTTLTVSSTVELVEPVDGEAMVGSKVMVELRVCTRGRCEDTICSRSCGEVVPASGAACVLATLTVSSTVELVVDPVDREEKVGSKAMVELRVCTRGRCDDTICSRSCGEMVPASGAAVVLVTLTGSSTVELVVEPVDG
jgi:hypothetical protein